MSTTEAAELIIEAKAAGLKLVPDGEALRVRGPAEALERFTPALREHKPELMRLLADQAEAAPAAPQGPAETYVNYGRGYRHADGRVEPDGTEPMPPPALPWPADLTDALKRVSVAFEWSRTDIADFTRWARRSPQGLADARAFLEAEVSKLPAPGLDDRRRTVLDRLAADPGARVAWTCVDDGVSDPVVLVLAIRGRGTCEMAIPRAKLNALALPLLIEELAAQAAE